MYTKHKSVFLKFSWILGLALLVSCFASKQKRSTAYQKSKRGGYDRQQCRVGKTYDVCIIWHKKREATRILEREKFKCQKGDALSCTRTGRLLENLSADMVAARIYYQKACESKDSPANILGCFYLGVQYQKGRGGPVNEKLAHSFYEKSCTGGNARACFNLGEMWSLVSESSAKDPIKAKEYYKKACEQGVPESCWFLGDMWKEGEGGQKNLKKAREYFIKACNLGDMDTCDLLLRLEQ